MSGAPGLRPRDEAAVPVARAFARLVHGDMHYRAAGEGPTVLALHASPRSSVSLLPVMEALASRFHVIAPDTPGYGLSTPMPQNAPTLEDFADALIALLDGLGVARAAVYGTHTGAAIALALARRAPERVGALVLDGLSAFTPAEVEAFRTDYLAPYTPAWDGAHVIRLWSRVKDLYTWFPWWERTPERRLAGEPAGPETLHAAALGFLQSGPHYAKAYVRAAELQPGPWLQALDVPALVMARPHDLIAHHLDRLPEPNGRWTLRRLGPSAAAWREALMQGLSQSLPTADERGEAPKPDVPALHDAGGRFVQVGAGWLHAVCDGPVEASPQLILPDLPGDAGELLRRLPLDAPARRIALSPPGCGASDPLCDPTGGLGSSFAALDAAWAALAGGRAPARITAEGAGAALAELWRARAGWSAPVVSLSPPAWLDAEAPGPERPLLQPRPPSFDGAHLTTAWFQLRDLQLYDVPPGRGPPQRRGDGAQPDAAALDRRFASYVQGPECAALLGQVIEAVRPARA